LARLDQLLVEDRADRWVVVTGGPGMGKSALLAAWLDRRECAWRHRPVSIASCTPRHRAAR
jgi:predicted ATPase